MFCTYDAREKPVVGQEFETGGFDVVRELVQLDAVLVVDEDVFLLRDCEVGMVM